MDMYLADWGIIGLLLLVMFYAATKTKKYTRSVADFLAANRCAGRYILGASDSIAGIGAVTIVAWFEGAFASGFCFTWWFMAASFVLIIVSLTGWIQYRFRQTRALTMAQFLEMRYSKRFRIFAGLVAFASGTINFGIFPAVGARFFMHFCGIPGHDVEIFSGFSIDTTYALIMLILLSIALYFTFAGGQIAVIVTDYIQSTFSNILLIIVLIYAFSQISWPQLYETLIERPEGYSMLNPLDTGKIHVFNPWFFIIEAFILFWTFIAWQGNQGYYVSGLNAHEARMGRVLGNWRRYTQFLMIVLLPIFAYVIMHHANWTPVAEEAASILDSVSTDMDNTIRKQITTTAVLRKFLPVGLFGSMCAIMLAAFISTHDTYLHSWGSIFIQDVVLPFREKPLDQKQHIRLLRWSIFGVAVFIFLFSLFFAQYDFILMFFAMTGIIWLGGAGTVIVGGLYWRRGKTSAAYVALIVGIVGFVITFTGQKLWPLYHDGELFPLNSQWMSFLAVTTSIVLYVIISLLGKKEDFNLDRLLHRGKYAVAEDVTTTETKPSRGWHALFGMGKEFTPRDKVVYMCITGWTVVWSVIFLLGTTLSGILGISTETWGKFWHFFTWMVLCLGIVTTVWFTIGGLMDLRKMFHRLATLQRDEADDGTVLEKIEKQ
jgi:SSS family solute:Na+ symporter